MKTTAPVCSDNERQRLADTLRLYVGQGRRVSWAALADQVQQARFSLQARAPAASSAP